MPPQVTQGLYDKCCLNSRHWSEEETLFLGKAVRTDFLEEVGSERGLEEWAEFS